MIKLKLYDLKVAGITASDAVNARMWYYSYDEDNSVTLKLLVSYEFWGLLKAYRNTVNGETTYKFSRTHLMK